MTPSQLEQLILAHQKPLELFASQWTFAPQDCVQEAFLKLFGLNQPVENAGAWLFRVVRNLAIDSGRSERSRKNREQVFGRRRALFVTSEADCLAGDEVQAALEQLASDQREVIVARIWGHLTFDEIAEALQIATSTAHRRYEVGIRNLQQYFEIPSRKGKTS